MASSDSLKGFGTRFGELIRVTGLSQADFAGRLDASPTFISDLVREQKRPGAEFLLRMKQSFGVSIDWLLDGSGTMLGERPVSVDAFKLVAAEVALARAAKIDDKPEAARLLHDLMSSSPAIAVDELTTALQPYLTLGEEIVFASILYNAHIGTTDLAERVRSALSTAAAYYESRRPLDLLRAAMGNATPTSQPSTGGGPMKIVIQKVGRNAKNAGRDFISSGTIKPKKK